MKMRLMRIAPWVLAAAAIVNTAVVALGYMFYPGYLDHGEGAISATAWRLLQGIPAYHSFADADRITNLYGPVTYLWYAWAPALFGGGVASSKAAAAVAALGAFVAATYLGMRRDLRLGLWPAVFAAAMIAWFLPFSVTIRPDGALTLLVGIAVMLAAWGDGRKSLLYAAALGVTAGLATNLKLHAAIYIGPAALFYGLGDLRRIPVMIGAGAATALLPFAMSIFPLNAYLEWFGPMAGKEVNELGFKRLWQHAAMTAAFPIGAWVVARKCRFETREHVYFGAFLAMAALCALPAAKIGGGAHYYMPFLPAALDLAYRAARGDAARGVRLWVAVASLITALAAFQTERRFFKRFEWEKSQAVVDEINAVLDDYAKLRVQMGVGRTPDEIGDQYSYHYYVWRNIPVFRGNPYTIDAGNMMEMTKLGFGFPEEAMERFRECHTQLWLIPKNGKPFYLFGYYFQFVFPAELVKFFPEKYEKIESRTYFDLWKCRE